MKRRTYLALAAATVAGTSGCGGRQTATTAQGTPTGSGSAPSSGDPVGQLVFTGESALSSRAQRATAGVEPWASAWRRLKADADASLDDPLRSVVEDGGVPKSLPTRLRSIVDGDGEHYFVRRANERHDYRSAIAMGDSVRDLGYAYFVTGVDEYARKAIDILHHWFLDPDTFMKPAAGGGDVALFITLPRFVIGASLVRGHSYWDSKSTTVPWDGQSVCRSERAFQLWLRDWAGDVSSTYENNIYIWWLLAEGTVFAYLRDAARFDDLVARYRAERAWNDYNDCRTDREGTFERELSREKSMNYQLWRMLAHTYFCELASWMGYDLYEYNAPTDSCPGSTLRKTLDTMIPFVREPGDWPWGSVLGRPTLARDMLHTIPCLYELAYSRWADRRYREMIRISSGRPVNDGRILGWVSFTHGNSFALE